MAGHSSEVALAWQAHFKNMSMKRKYVSHKFSTQDGV